jgi:hypothetical protein
LFCFELFFEPAEIDRSAILPARYAPSISYKIYSEIIFESWYLRSRDACNRPPAVAGQLLCRQPIIVSDIKWMIGGAFQSPVTLALDCHKLAICVTAALCNAPPTSAMRQHFVADKNIFNGDHATHGQHHRSGWKAWATAGPHLLVVPDASASKGCGPDANSGKEVDLSVGGNVVGREIDD